MCEDCGKKRPHYGLPDSGKRRWCADCAKDQPGETERIDKHKMCEDCGKKHAKYGKVGSTKCQWCGTCAKKHRGVRLGKRKMCEDCGKKRPHYGLPNTPGRKYRWCATCAEQHGGSLFTSSVLRSLEAGALC